MNYPNNFSTTKLVQGTPITFYFKEKEIKVFVPTLSQELDLPFVDKALGFLSLDCEEINSYAKNTGFISENMKDAILVSLKYNNLLNKDLEKFFSLFIPKWNYKEEKMFFEEVELDEQIVADFIEVFLTGTGRKKKELEKEKENGNSELRKSIEEKRRRNQEKINKIKNKNKSNEVNLEKRLLTIAYELKVFSFDELFHKNVYTIEWLYSFCNKVIEERIILSTAAIAGLEKYKYPFD